MSATALHAAADCYRSPERAVALRRAPLPDGVTDVLRVLAKDDAAVETAGRMLGMERGALHDACRLYVVEVVMHAGADDFRVFGANRAVPREHLAEHRRILLKWLHPDRSTSPQDAHLFQRASDAWERILGSRAIVAQPIAAPARTKSTVPRRLPAAANRKARARARAREETQISQLMALYIVLSQKRRRVLVGGVIVVGFVLLITVIASELDRLASAPRCPYRWAAALPLCTPTFPEPPGQRVQARE